MHHHRRKHRRSLGTTITPTTAPPQYTLDAVCRAVPTFASDNFAKFTKDFSLLHLKNLNRPKINFMAAKSIFYFPKIHTFRAHPNFIVVRWLNANYCKFAQCPCSDYISMTYRRISMFLYMYEYIDNVQFCTYYASDALLSHIFMPHFAIILHNPIHIRSPPKQNLFSLYIYFMFFPACLTFFTKICKTYRF